MHRLIWISCLFLSSPALATDVLFTSGPQEFAGRRYYWLAEWTLEVTLPVDVGPTDSFEILFGTKGMLPRTLHFQYASQTGSIAQVRKSAYEWVPLPLEKLKPEHKVVLSGTGREQVAFLAGVRVRGQANAALKVTPIRTAHISSNGEDKALWAVLPGFEVNDTTSQLWDPAPQQPDWSRAERSAQYAGIALTKVQRWLRERCLPVRDERSGLFRPTGAEWNYRDTAADCYPFYVWAAFYTDPALLDTVMIPTLEAEQRLCNHRDRLPVSYNMDWERKIELDLEAIIFGASEYAKDGLVPIVEITGPESPWFQRLTGLVEDIFHHAQHDTPYGKIPSTNIEVNGELLQILPRLYSVTGRPEYLQWAHRLADSYLLPGQFIPTHLSDHGCEIIGGLGLLFAVDTTAHPEKGRQYQPHLEYLFDQILRRGVNSDGIIVGTLQDKPGPHDQVPIRDGWGYDFVGFLDYDLALGTRRYEQAIRRPMANLLKPRYHQFNWDHGSRDNIADSVEGGLYLLHRFPTPEAFVWADREVATVLVDHTDADRLWGVHKLEANTVRTVLIHTMLHTRNTIMRPWQSGLQLGAAPYRTGLCLFLKSEQPYQGRLQFDIPRHRLYLGLKQDWPRMNAVPEWFVVEPDEVHRYSVGEPGAPDKTVVSGRSLREGWPVHLKPGQSLRLLVEPVEDSPP